MNLDEVREMIVADAARATGDKKAGILRFLAEFDADPLAKVTVIEIEPSSDARCVGRCEVRLGGVPFVSFTGPLVRSPQQLADLAVNWPDGTYTLWARCSCWEPSRPSINGGSLTVFSDCAAVLRIAGKSWVGYA